MNRLDEFDPALDGVVYPLTNALSPHESLFDELNYLSDGLLARDYSKGILSLETIHLIHSQCFGKPFFIALLSQEQPEKLKQVLSVLNPSESPLTIGVIEGEGFDSKQFVKKGLKGIGSQVNWKVIGKTGPVFEPR